MQATAARQLARALTVVGVVGTLGAGPAASALPSAIDVLARVNEHDARVESYAVPVHMEVRIHKLFTFHIGLSGTQYFKRPGRLALDIHQIPPQYRKLFADLGTPLTWPATYDMRLAATANSRYQLDGVPRRPCDVEHLAVDVDGDPGAPLHAVWRMHDGSTIDMHITEQLESGYDLPKHADADMAFGGYRIHASIDYGAYTVNEAVADSVFGA
ncbi:MAG TPA: hypothetical protein VHT53_14085 [Candidatus Elarobacter sp.]|jgi:hypothetical protein|nr:hypothetical protein [Candidatus Elarobacter sp.]